MSKAEHAIITSVKPTPTHPSALSTASPSTPRDSLKLRLLASLWHAAVVERGPLTEHTPECIAAEARADAALRKLKKHCEHIWRRPVRSWADLHVLAEIAYYWAHKAGNDDPAVRAPMRCLTDKSADKFDIASAHLIAAVLNMGGAHV